MGMKGLSIIIAAYNEAENIRETAESVLREIPPAITDFELILVDDGSSDGTGEIIESLSSSNSLIHAVQHPLNLGKGAALISGFKRCGKDWIIFLDADGQIAFSELAAFLPFTESFDMIIGYRINRRLSFLRRLLSWGYKRLTACFLDISVKDVGCPFKLFRKSILESMALKSRGFIIDAELLYKTISRGFRIKELPVSSQRRRRGASKVGFYDAFDTLKEFIKLLVKLHR